MTRLTHLAQVFRSMGGVESVLRHHHQADAGQKIESQFVVYQEDASTAVERVVFLGLDQRCSIHRARMKMKAAVAQASPEVAVYHSVWGMSYWADLDGAQRRILVLHSDFPGLEESLRPRGGLIEGLLCVSEVLRQKVAEWLPHLGADWVGLLHYPVLPRVKASSKPPLNNRSLVIGFCGRLMFEQKRVERLPALCARLDQAGLDYRFEFLGDGPERGWLETRLADPLKFVFHGRKAGDDYWHQLDRWDAIAFVSDFEGTPIALLEAMSMGVIPIYPRINSGGDAVVAAVGPELLYEPEDFGHVAAFLGEFGKWSQDQVDGLRSRCQQAVSPYLGANYITEFAAFVGRVGAAPRISQEQISRPPWPIEHLPLNWVARLGLFRRGIRRLVRR